MWHFIISLLVAMIITTIPATKLTSVSKFCTIQPATPAQQSVLFDQVVQKLFIEKNVDEAYHTYVVEDLIQNDAFSQSGAQASIDILNQILPGSTLVIYHKTFETINSTGWVHTKASGGSFFGNQTAIADLYRFNGTCIVEHWDVVQMRPANTTNPLALF